MKKKVLFYNILFASIMFTNIIKVKASSISYFATTATECQELFGEDTMSLFRMIFTIIRWAVPAALIITISFDYVKALTSPKPDTDLKKSTQTALTRLVIAVIIFLFPGILNLLLSIIDSSTCGI